MNKFIEKIFSLKGTLLKFAVVGASGIVVNQGLLALQVDILGIDLKIAGVIAIEFSILNNFFLNNMWTWKTRKKNNLFSRLLRYHMVTALSGGINYITLLVLTDSAEMHYLTANLIGICLGMIINFTLNHLWTFQKNESEL
jgi:dolichol-phosphate mannosyltransferase